MQLIDADALIDEIKYITGQDTIMWFFDRIIKREQKVNMEAFIELMPTIDAVPVVRCKDCEFYTEDERWCRRLGLCGAFAPDDYCSHAERSEDDGNK